MQAVSIVTLFIYLLRFASSGSAQQCMAPLREPLTVPSPMRYGPPHWGLRPLLFMNNA